MTYRLVTPVGRRPMPSFTASSVVTDTPTVLPITRPSITPQVTRFDERVADLVDAARGCRRWPVRTAGPPRTPTTDGAGARATRRPTRVCWAWRATMQGVGRTAVAGELIGVDELALAARRDGREHAERHARRGSGWTCAACSPNQQIDAEQRGTPRPDRRGGGPGRRRRPRRCAVRQPPTARRRRSRRSRSR